MIIEPLVQGAAGMQLADRDGLARLGAACAEHDVLLICDEVATGFGRTGTLFASEQANLRPDLLCLGKAMTAGYLAMSVTVASDRVFRSFLGDDLGERTLYHGHSYGGNALAAAVALRHLELFDAWDVLANVRERSDELRDLLHDRVASKPAVREVRLEGLMGGVELAPPTDGLRWGRQVSAAAVQRGVLLRPIGDTVVLMPPLTITSPEIHQIVNALSDSIDDVCDDPTDGRAHDVECVGRERSARGIRAAGRWRAPRDLDVFGVEGILARREGRNVVSFASNDYLGLTSHPTVIAAAHEALDRWGTGAGSARLIVGSRPIHSELERELAEWKEHRAQRALPHRLRREPRRAHDVRHRGRARVLRRAQPRVDHRRLPPRARRRDRVPPPRPRSPAHAAARSRRPPRARGERHRVLDGRRRRRRRRADRALRAGARAARARRSARGAWARRARRARRRRVARRHLLEDARRARRIRRRARRATSSSSRTRPGPTSSRPRRRPPTPRPRSPRSGSSGRAEGDALVARLRANVDRLRPGHPSPILPFVCGEEQVAIDAAAVLLEHGLVVPAIRPPTVAPGTSRLRVAMSAAHTDAHIDRLLAALAEVFGDVPSVTEIAMRTPMTHRRDRRHRHRASARRG